MFYIGEFSKMGKTTIKTLRHYDRIGLLHPEAVDGATGYRLYTTRQLVQRGRDGVRQRNGRHRVPRAGACARGVRHAPRLECGPVAGLRVHCGMDRTERLPHVRPCPRVLHRGRVERSRREGLAHRDSNAYREGIASHSPLCRSDDARGGAELLTSPKPTYA